MRSCLARPLAALVLVLAAAGANGVGSARADRNSTVLHVRSRLRIDLEAIERIKDGVRVSGTLRDEATEAPVGERTVAIAVDGRNGFYRYAEPTGEDGRFEWRVPLPLGAYTLELGAGGDADYARAAPVKRDIDIAKRTPRLALSLPADVDAEASALRLVVRAEDDDGRPLDEGQVTVQVGGHHLVATLPRAQAGVELPGPFGRPGELLAVTAALAASEHYDAAEVHRTLRVTSGTTLTLRAQPRELGRDEALVVDGELRDAAGPVSGGAIVIMLAGAVPNAADPARAAPTPSAAAAPAAPGNIDLASLGSDAHGHFGARLRGAQLPLGDVTLTARYTPADSFHRGSRASPLTLHVLAARPPASWPYLMSPLLTLVVLGALKLGRRRPWAAWRRRLTAHPPSAPEPAAGLLEQRPRLLASLRGPSDHGLDGIVIDAADGRALAGATLTLQPAGSGERVITADGDGRFAVEGLAPGPLTVEVSAAGYVSERFTRALPHRGELRATRVRLDSIRARIFATWRAAAADFALADPELPTPRELYELVSAGDLGPSEPLGRLTTLVELACWSGADAGVAELREAEELAARVRGARPAAPVAAEPIDPNGSPLR